MSPSPPVQVVLRSAGAVIAALALGVLTAYAQVAAAADGVDRQLGRVLGARGVRALADGDQRPHGRGPRIVAGLVLLLAVARLRQLDIRAVALSIGVAVLMAVAFVAFYGLDLFTLLP